MRLAIRSLAIPVLLVVALAGCSRRTPGPLADADPPATRGSGEIAREQPDAAESPSGLIDAAPADHETSPETNRDNEPRFTPVAEVDRPGVPLSITPYPGRPPVLPETVDGETAIAVAFLDGDAYGWFVSGDAEAINPALDVLDIVAGVVSGEETNLDRYVREVAGEAAMDQAPPYALLFRERDDIALLRIPDSAGFLVFRIYVAGGRAVDIEWYEEVAP